MKCKKWLSVEDFLPEITVPLNFPPGITNKIKLGYGNTIEDVILFLLSCTFVVPSFKNTASIFPEISFIQYFTIFVANNMTSSLI